jgi:hypothetical protein
MKAQIITFSVPLFLVIVASLTAQGAPTAAQLEEENLDLRQKVRALERQLAAIQADQPKAAGGKATIEPAPALEETPVRGTDRVIDNIILRRSVFDEKFIERPAEMTYVRPGSGPASYSIDAGVAVKLLPLFSRTTMTSWDIRLGAEYHRDSKITSPKEVFQTGINFVAVAGKATSPLGALLNGDLSYKTDNVADARSIAGSLDVLPRVDLLRTDDFIDIGPTRIRWQPFVGLLYESAYDTAANVDEGHRLVGRYGAELVFYPAWKAVEAKLEVRARYTAWTALDATGLYEGDDWSSFIETGITYWFNRRISVPGVRTADEMEVGLGLTYENGDNPELSIKDIDQLTLSLQARF